jgi:hypothetical protein
MGILIIKNRKITHEVNIWILSGLSFFGGSGRNGVSKFSIFWKSAGIPGNIHSLPSRRTTGCVRMELVSTA